VGRSPAGMDVSTEAEDIVEIRYQATASEDRRFSVCCSGVRELVRGL
jgi:hypothetical protein